MRGKRTALVAVGALLIVAGAICADLLLHQGKIHRGVTFWSVDLGGHSEDAAHIVLEHAAAERLARPVSVLSPSTGETIADIMPLEVGVTARVDEALERAGAWGRQGNVFEQLWERLRLWFVTVDTPVTLDVGGAAFERAVDEIAVQVERVPKDASLVIDGAEPKVIAGEEGVGLDREALKAALLEAVQVGSSRISTPVTLLPSNIPTADAMIALDVAALFFSAPVKLTYRDVTFHLMPEDLMNMTRFCPEGFASGRMLTVNTEQGLATLRDMLAQMEQDPVDAEVVPADDGRSYSVIPSRDGVQVQWDALVRSIDQAALRTSSRHVAVPVAIWPPKLTTLDAELLRARRVVAVYTTYFSSANEARVGNIRQVAAAVDGRVVRPGDIFSFNAAVGPRTKAAGYDEAPVISNGVLTPGVGGGICQVSTTMFNAVLLAGLPIVERRPHSLFIERYPVGRDATVSYGSEDFRFRNDTASVLLINIEATDDSVEVRLSAADLDRRVELTTDPVTDIVSPSSSETYPRVLVDPTLPRGYREPLEPGIDGRTVTVRREVYSSDGHLLFSDKFVSRYEPKDWIVRVGG
ncbi:MAG: hypothetical protein GX604_06645 [Actinobacteria bacterium]|nr:hypothetical protein [Actinomycetota bacterium]